MADDAEKTEEPTGKRISETRDAGQVAKSVELNGVAILIVSFWGLYIFRDKYYQSLLEMTRLLLQESMRIKLDFSNFCYYTKIGSIWLLKLILPIMLMIMVAGIFINIVQVGWLFTTKPLVPNFSKVNPLSGIKNLFSMTKLFDLAKEVVKLCIIGSIAYVTIKNDMAMYMIMSDQSVEQILIVIFDSIFKLGIRIAAALLLLSIIDFMYQKYQNNKKMKMTKEEVKDERKQTEGDPQVKSKLKSLQVEMAMRRMMGSVPKATVVVTNPTFIAIALKYEMGVDKAPMVLAKGKRKTAERIREIAKENNIPIVEDKPLARAMYDVIEVGSEISREFFTPVAEILAYIYKLKEKAA